VTAKGKGLTAVTHAKKHPRIVLGVGLLALTGVAVWFGRGRIVETAVAARPKVARVIRPAVLSMVKRRPLQAAKLAAKYPGSALRLAKALR
jgi:hypothetical protein